MRSTGCRALICAAVGVAVRPGRTRPTLRPGPGRTRLPGERAEPAVGGRPDPDPHRRGRVVAGQRPGCVRQPDRRLGHRPARTTTLVLTALNHALRSRDLHAGKLIFHSDKGAQYTALRFTQRLVDAGSPLDRQHRGQLRQRAGREPLVHAQGRAPVLARHHVRHPDRGRTRPGPLHRRVVQPAPYPSRDWAGSHPTSTKIRYHRGTARPRQVTRRKARSPSRLRRLPG